MTAEPLRVFLVEDHQDTLKSLKLYLEQSGHIVSTARNKAEAMAALSASSFDLLLSDIALTDGSGWDLLSELGPTRPPYAIAMSGYGTRADASRSEAVGFRHHLVKPIDPDALDERVAEALLERDRKQ